VPPETVVFGVDGMHDVEVRADLVYKTVSGDVLYPTCTDRSIY
jgi:hypothetical protein